jgi:uncharacterized membrane protein (DUF4010 family)
MSLEVYHTLATSLGLGLLVGLQRQWRASEIAGIRTFPLITLLGALAIELDGGEPGWTVAAALLGLTGLLVAANLARFQAQRGDPGMTTEAAVLLMFTVGAAVGAGLHGPAIVTTGATAVLLHWKQPLHDLVQRIGERDLRGLIQLVLVAMVILPVLPDHTYGPYDVLNPYRIWLLVVLIVGISLAAYVAYRLLGAKRGAILGGLLGGFISSTATTVSYARQSRSHPRGSAIAALVIVLASTIVYLRVLIEIAVVSPDLLKLTLLPLGGMLALMLLESVVLMFSLRRHKAEPPDHENPAQLKAAVAFGALYAAVLFIVAAANHHFGDQALYVVATISGLTDVDAITLSTAKLFEDGRVEGAVAWRVVLIATLSNLVFKAGAVAVLGSHRLLIYVVVLFAVALVGGAALLLYLPEIELASLPLVRPG